MRTEVGGLETRVERRACQLRGPQRANGAARIGADLSLAFTELHDRYHLTEREAAVSKLLAWAHERPAGPAARHLDPYRAPSCGACAHEAGRAFEGCGRGQAR